ncbi:response regulator [bacterium]|nr:response regulator [bacterium]
MSKKVIFIDDEKDFTDLLTTMLHFHNIEAVTLNDPVVALKELEKQTYDLILTDLMMPEVSGFDIIKSARADSRYKKTPIIVLTAKTLSDAERKLLFQNDVHFYVKPFEPQELVGQIKTLLAG